MSDRLRQNILFGALAFTVLLAVASKVMVVKETNRMPDFEERRVASKK